MLTTILLFILGTQTVAKVIVNLTPTPVDDNWVAKFYSFIEYVAGIWTSKAKEVNEATGK